MALDRFPYDDTLEKDLTELTGEADPKDIPRNVCTIEMIGLARTTTYEANTVDHDGVKLESGKKELVKYQRYFIPVRTLDDTPEQVENLRRVKGFRVVKMHNLHLLSERTPDERSNKAKLVQRIQAMAFNPEAVAVARQKDSLIAELEAKLTAKEEKAKKKGEDVSA